MGRLLPTVRMVSVRQRRGPRDSRLSLPDAMDLNSTTASETRNSTFGRGLIRAFAGAIIFGIPLLMTMETWRLGFYLPPWKLALFLGVFFPFLVVLSWHAGFERTFSWRNDIVDALVAYAVGYTCAAVILLLMGVLEAQMSLRAAVGIVSLQAVPASMGALLAQSQLGERKAGGASGRGAPRYASELFVMAVGALFLAFNLAPTEEMLLIAFRMTQWHVLALIALSIAVMHGFVYGGDFRGQPEHPELPSGWSLFLRFTVVGYALACLVSAYILWSFGSLESMSPGNCIKVVAVLGFPAAVGAAAARLIL